MDSVNRLSRTVQSGNIADLAFALVVLAAYFTIFSNIHSLTGWWLLAIIGLGVIYISVGIYGFSLANQSSSFSLRLSYFVVQLITGNLVLYLGDADGFNAMILLPITAHSVVLLPEAWRYVVNGAMALAYGTVLWLMTGSVDDILATLPIFAAGQVFVLIFTQMTLSEVKSRKEVQQLAEELSEANQQLREYAAQVEMLAVEKERNRLAREIHDGIGHHLTAANMQAKAARAVLRSDPAQSEQLLANVEHLTQRALLDVRQSVSALRENQFESANLVEQLQAAAQTAKNTGLAVDLTVQGQERSLSPEVRLTILRAVQEGISNTLKHARASCLAVTLDFDDPAWVRLDMCDDGVGSETQVGGYGLIGMRERVNLLDGTLRINTSQGSGFEIEIRIPEKP
jgi:signal transduction histidine kinase